MTLEQKEQIVAAAIQYKEDKGMSQAKFARFSGANESYVSDWFNGKHEHRAKDGTYSPIGDANYHKAARAIGMSLIVAYWRTVETPQFIEMISTLEDAKERGAAKMIIGETGCGKTFSANKFIEGNPVNTFKITVSNQHKIQEVTEELGQVMDVALTVNHRKASRMRTITDRLKELHAKGGRPIVIIDESENLTHGMIGLCKGIYDAINEYASLVLIGTPELIMKLDKMEKYCYSYPGIPQFRRRFKAGTVHLTPIDRRKHYDAFFEDVQDMELRTLLRGLCNNYGELHDFLEPAIRAAAEDGVMLTDQYFRIMYKIGVYPTNNE